VSSNRIQIRYFLYHIRIRTQPSDTDTVTDIGRYEKNDIRIRQNRISYTDLILADRMRILIGYVKIDTIKYKLNKYTYITFYLIYNNIKCDTCYDIIVYISILPLYPLSFGFSNNGLHDLWC